MWGRTAGLDRLEADQVCARLAGLALVTIRADGIGGGGGGGVVMHNVIRDLLRADAGPAVLAGLNRVLVDAAAARLPEEAESAAGAESGGRVVAWWQLDATQRYLWDHLIEHIKDGHGAEAAAAAAGDLRWAGARVERFNPAAAAADLVLHSRVADDPH